MVDWRGYAYLFDSHAEGPFVRLEIPGERIAMSSVGEERVIHLTGEFILRGDPVDVNGVF